MFIEMQIGNQLDEDDYLHFDYQSIIIMKKKVFVSGCYDLLHSGHVEFFQQASQYGDGSGDACPTGILLRE